MTPIARKTLQFGTVGALCLALIAFAAQKRHAPVARTNAGQAPSFTLPSPEGASVELSALHGQVVLVNFWGTWCAPCDIEMPWLADLREKYRSAG